MKFFNEEYNQIDFFMDMISGTFIFFWESRVVWFSILTLLILVILIKRFFKK